MPQSQTTQADSFRLLLATDLSAHCDRALDRAVQLAETWHAELMAVNVLDPAATPDQALAWLEGLNDEDLVQLARRQFAHDLPDTPVRVSLRVERGCSPASVIRATANDVHARLVLAGMSRNEAVGRFLLGSTLEQLSRSLAQALLVVRQRPRGPYQRIVVATDFSDSSRHALLAAMHFFPGSELILYHAHALPMGGLGTSRLHGEAALGGAFDAFLANTPPARAARIHPVVEDGTPESALTRYVRRHDVDLVVLGSHGRSAMTSLLLGSTAARLLDWLPCDTLLVPEPLART